jgi:hypothetical protein
MITNLPSSNDYLRVAKQCLNQAFSIVYDIDKVLVHYEDVDPEDLWQFHLGDLSTSLILIHQGLESFLKSEICKVSPLLLIDVKRADWPTLPDSGDKEYNELYGIGAEALIRTYCSVIPEAVLSSEVTTFVDGIRLARNKIVHGLSREYLEPEYLVETVLKSYTYFLGKDSWWLSMRESRLNNPLFGSFDTEYEEAKLVEVLNYVQGVVDKAEFKKHFSLDMSSRNYFCPWCCTHILRVEGTRNESKWAYLTPQRTPDVTTLMCVNCQRVSSINRIRCNQEECKGNVIYEDDYEGENICATCGGIQDPTD